MSDNKTGKENIFTAALEDENTEETTEIVVKLSEDGIITSISAECTTMEPISTGIEGNPHNEDTLISLEGCFEKMLNINLDTFKAMLKRIEKTEPEYFKIGKKLLAAKKAALIEEAKKYSL